MNRAGQKLNRRYMTVYKQVLSRLSGRFYALAALAGVLLADVPDNLDLGRDDVQLFGSDFTDLGQNVTIMRTESFISGKLMDNVYTG